MERDRMPVQQPTQTSSLLEVLEKILDKGVVIAGDIKIALADVDLLTIKIRLLVASVDKAREIGMDWWERDPYYSSKAKIEEKEHTLLLERVDRLEQLIETKSLPMETGKLMEPIREKVLNEPVESTAAAFTFDKITEKSSAEKNDSAKKERDSQHRKHDKKKPRGKH
jgi:hypothetical protein